MSTPTDSPAKQAAPMLVARVDVEIAGVKFEAGISRIRADHELVRGHEDLFEEVPEAERAAYSESVIRVTDEPIFLVEPGRLN